MTFIHNGWTVRVYQQRHPAYPPWVATATKTVDDKQRLFNVEGQTAEETAERAKKRIETK